MVRCGHWSRGSQAQDRPEAGEEAPHLHKLFTVGRWEPRGPEARGAAGPSVTCSSTPGRRQYPRCGPGLTRRETSQRSHQPHPQESEKWPPPRASSSQGK